MSALKKFAVLCLGALACSSGAVSAQTTPPTVESLTKDLAALTADFKEYKQSMADSLAAVEQQVDMTHSDFKGLRAKIMQDEGNDQMADDAIEQQMGLIRNGNWLAGKINAACLLSMSPMVTAAADGIQAEGGEIQSMASSPCPVTSGKADAPTDTSSPSEDKTKWIIVGSVGGAVGMLALVGLMYCAYLQGKGSKKEDPLGLDFKLVNDNMGGVGVNP